MTLRRGERLQLASFPISRLVFSKRAEPRQSCDKTKREVGVDRLLTKIFLVLLIALCGTAPGVAQRLHVYDGRVGLSFAAPDYLVEWVRLEDDIGFTFPVLLSAEGTTPMRGQFFVGRKSVRFQPEASAAAPVGSAAVEFGRVGAIVAKEAGALSVRTSEVVFRIEPLTGDMRHFFPGVGYPLMPEQPRPTRRDRRAGAPPGVVEEIVALVARCFDDPAGVERSLKEQAAALPNREIVPEIPPSRKDRALPDPSMGTREPMAVIWHGEPAILFTSGQGWTALVYRITDRDLIGFRVRAAWRSSEVEGLSLTAAESRLNRPPPRVLDGEAVVHELPKGAHAVWLTITPTRLRIEAPGGSQEGRGHQSHGCQQGRCIVSYRTQKVIRTLAEVKSDPGDRRTWRVGHHLLAPLWYREDSVAMLAPDPALDAFLSTVLESVGRAERQFREWSRSQAESGGADTGEPQPPQ